VQREGVAIGGACHNGDMSASVDVRSTAGRVAFFWAGRSGK